MLGTHAQEGFFQTDRHLLDFVGRDSFYGRLAALRGELFRDEDFAELYCIDNGRPSVSPALLATATLLQAHDKVSDREAKRRADMDLGWKVALGTEVTERPFAKSTLQLFRSQLIVHDKARRIFTRSIEHARNQGLLQGRRMKLAVDTTAILGRGAVRDTWNLIGDGIRLLIGALAELAGRKTEEWAAAAGYGIYVGKSLKGGADIDWSDRGQRRKFLARIVNDADALLERARQALEGLPEGDACASKILSCSRLLSQILIQDVRRVPAKEPPSDSGSPGWEPEPEAAAGEVEIVKGGGRDRIVSAHDPEMRHGRKSSSHRFAGHKGAIAADLESGLITAVAVIPGNAPDAEGALGLVRQAEANAAASAKVVIGDCAYGDGDTRKDFADDGYDLFARPPGRPRSDYFLKQDFAIDLEAKVCTCPAGQTTADYRRSRPRRKWKTRRAGVFHFAPEQCGPCPLRERCFRSQKAPSRSISIHPQEQLLQQARVRQQGVEGRALGRLRTRIEHRLARLCQLGIRQSRFFGRERTGFQLMMAAAVANLTLAEGIGKNRAPLPPVRDPEPSPAAADAGLDMTESNRAGSDNPGRAVVMAAGGGRVAASAADCGRQAGSAAGTGFGEYLRPIAAPARNGAVAIASIAATVRKSCARGRQGALNRLEGLRSDFGAVANPFATRCPNWASRPAL